MGFARGLFTPGYVYALIAVVYVMIVNSIVYPHITFETYAFLNIVYVSLLTTGFMLARSVGSLLFIPLTTRTRLYIYMPLILFIQAMIIVFYMESPVDYYVYIKLLEGLTAGLFWPLIQAITASSLPIDWRNRGISLYFIVGNIAGYLGVYLGGIIYTYYGATTIYYTGITLLLLFTVFTTIYFYKYRDQITYTTKTGKRQGLKNYLRTMSSIKTLLILAVIVGGLNGLLKDYLIAHVYRSIGGAEYTARTYWTSSGYIGLLLSYILSYTVDKTKNTMILFYSTYMIPLSLIIISLGTNPLYLVTGIALAIAGTRIVRPIIRGVASTKASVGESIALINSFSNIGAAIIPLAIAFTEYYITKNYVLPLTIYSIVVLISITYITIRHRSEQL